MPSSTRIRRKKPAAGKKKTRRHKRSTRRSKRGGTNNLGRTLRSEFNARERLIDRFLDLFRPSHSTVTRTIVSQMPDESFVNDILSLLQCGGPELWRKNKHLIYYIFGERANNPEVVKMVSSLKYTPALCRRMTPAQRKDVGKFLFVRTTWGRGIPTRFHLNDMQMVAKAFDLTLDDITEEGRVPAFTALANAGELSGMKWMVRRFRIPRELALARNADVFTLACEHGKLDMAKWLAGYYRITPAEVRASGAYTKACDFNQQEVVDWLRQQFGMPKECPPMDPVMSNWFGWADPEPV